MKNVKKIAMLLLVFIPLMPLAAQEESAAESGVKSDTSLILQISSLPEAKFIFSQNWAVPVLQGSNPLVSGNNIKFGINAEITPVCMSLLGNAVLTPIAFLEFSFGGMIGTGWNIEGLGNGIGVNNNDSGKTKIEGSPFGGTFTGANFGGAFQFDLAAVVPGDWNHVVVRVYQEANIKTYSGANRADAWVFESDHGENQNGWNYLANYTLGYQMPIFLNMVALQAEVQKYLFNYPDSASWGGNETRWDFGFIMNFQIARQFSGMLVTQFRLYRDYDDFKYPISVFGKKSGGVNNDRHYSERDYLDSKTLQFYRVAAVLTYKIK